MCYNGNFSHFHRFSVKLLNRVRCSAASVSACVSVCPHDKTKTAEITITKLVTEIVHHESSPNQLILGQKVKGQGHRVTKRKNISQAIEWQV